jgi:HSP20 family protein
MNIVRNNDGEIVLKAELPDASAESLDISVDNSVLTIKGEQKVSYAFSRSFSLPRTVDSSKVSADYKDGVLTIKLPPREEAKPRQIKVDIAA